MSTELPRTELTAPTPSEKESLEIQMLKQELRDGRIKLVLSILASILVVIGIVVDRMKAYEQQRTEARLREREINLALYRQTSETYLALTDAASTIAACRNYHQVEQASHEFLKQYFGRAHIIAVENPDVSQAKIAFRQALKAYLAAKSEISPSEYFGDLALGITRACRPHINPQKLK